MELTGANCGAYEVWGPIGEGGMSRVWLARHRELGCPVVIKTLRPEGGDSSEAAFARLRREARMMASIPEPRIVRAVDVGLFQDEPYLVQEYVDGLDLSELEKRRRAAVGQGLPLWYVCRVVAEVAEALRSAHMHGVVHRDVKPSNLLGSAQTGVKLGDFGIAIAGRAPLASAEGTLHYVAPETLLGSHPTRRGDVYSLGATAFDLFYGRPPLPTNEQILSGEAVVFRPARSAEEAYFQHVVAAMLAREPEKRFASTATPGRLLDRVGRMITPSSVGTCRARGSWLFHGIQIDAIIGDIADADADGIVNSANDEMTMRAGVGDALRRRGGECIEEEALALGRRALGECVATRPGTLSCRAVLHAVSAWNEVSCIARTFQRALLLASEMRLATLAVPAIGTGMARVAGEACAHAVGSALREHALLGRGSIERVTFVLPNSELHTIFIDALDELLLSDVDAFEPSVQSSGEEVMFSATVRFDTGV